MNRKKILNLASKASRAVKPHYDPIMQCLNIHFQNGVMTIRAANNKMEITVWDDVSESQSENPFTAIVKADIFKSILSKLTSDDITIKKKANNLILQGGGINLKLPCIDKPFPEIQKLDNIVHCFKIYCKDVLECKHSLASKNMEMQMMSSYCLELENDTYRITTTDGKRMSSRGVISKANVEFVVDEEILNESIRLDDKDYVTFSTDKMSVKLEGEQYSVIGKINYSKFFNIEKFRELQFPSYFRVKSEKLIEVLQVSSLLDVSNIIKVKDGKLTITCKNDKGFADAEIPGDICGKNIEIGINGMMLIEALNSITDEEVEVRYRSPQDPIYLTGEGYTELIMPVRIA